VTLDIKKLVTALRQTEKDNDNEVLVAIRMANRMLKAAGKHWGDVIQTQRFSPETLDRLRDDITRATQRQSARTYGAPASSMNRRHRAAQKEEVRGDDIPRMLATLRGRQHEMSFLMFLASVTRFYSDKGYLTRDQYDAVKKSYERMRP
jgi:hypothetical protein